VTFVRCLDDGVLSRITGYFHSPSQIVSEGQPLEVGEIVKHFNEQVENFTKRGSGYVLEEIVRLTLSVVKYRPMRGGSSYIETPPWLRAKGCCVNVKNASDDFCFKWAILSALYPPKHNLDRLSNYLPYQDRLDFTNLSFPMVPNKISLFEQQNRHIDVHVFQ